MVCGEVIDLLAQVWWEWGQSDMAVKWRRANSHSTTFGIGPNDEKKVIGDASLVSR